MSQLKDPIREGLARGWKVMGGPRGPVPEKITCDVAIIGSGAGAGITAELLAKAGLQVVIIEEGPLKSSSDFNQKESEAYPSLYQESAARKTEDKAINILQGRCVGGSTTVNWTSSFRTPASTLKFWQDKFGLGGYNVEALAPYFDQAEQRLNITPWLVPPNENNDLLRRGAAKLGIPASAISRNVKGAGTWAPAVSVARPMPSSPCWSPPSPRRSTWVRCCWSKPARKASSWPMEKSRH
jgi:choline dehydrogenase-like flavoprotein